MNPETDVVQGPTYLDGEDKCYEFYAQADESCEAYLTCFGCCCCCCTFCLSWVPLCLWKFICPECESHRTAREKVLLAEDLHQQALEYLGELRLQAERERPLSMETAEKLKIVESRAELAAEAVERFKEYEERLKLRRGFRLEGGVKRR
eukprot:GGOE01018342.1.p2 GENE.GGOE01018342.1~~GGOE01018342.1.p2  ORF type:complete len:149 (+),score=13.86 GGOE01018342.1:353-799(+)